MSQTTRGDETLPSLQDYAAAYRGEPGYYLTIVFHPDAQRIGERAVLDFSRGFEVVIGRKVPAFTSGLALEDPYVSRRALVLTRHNDSLRLSRPADASRCRVDGREVRAEQLIDLQRLSAGVPLLLSHSVVLLLHSSDARPQPGLPACGLVGQGFALQRLRKQILQAAGSDRDVLLRGATGTGKELVARAVHQLSARAGAPLVAVNMAAIPAPLAAASLFGSARGAYTGAAKSRTGYFQQAQGGTLFLDEIGDAPEDVQPLLLRAIQEREVQCVGGALQQIDLRVVSATDASIDAAESGFNRALRHRLGAVEIEVPPLRAHAEDIGELLCHFLRAAARQEGAGDPLPRPDSQARRVAAWALIFHAFLRYDWPGNVRQLANYAAQVLLESGERPQLPASVRAAFASGDEEPPPAPVAEVPGSQGESRLMRDISDAEFRQAMQDCDYEIAAVSAALGVSRPALYRRIDRSEEFRLVAQISEAEIQQALQQHAGDLHAAAQALRVSSVALRNRMRHADSEG